MEQHEAIIIKALKPMLFQALALKAIRYALISVPFTYNRMEKFNILSRIENIFKGKLAEEIFYHYCQIQHIDVDFESCTTPFWMSDQRDFLWLGGEWDLKNNFFYCTDEDFERFDFTLLPALIPNKTDYDQWSKRNETLLNQSKYMAYIFSFVRLRPDKKAFFKVLLDHRQLDFIHHVAAQYHNLPHSKMASFETWFFQQLDHSRTSEAIEIYYQPEMIITACANARYYHLFHNTSVNDDHYALIHDMAWYEKKSKVVRFLDGKLVTTIRNRTCPVSLLPAFINIAFRK